MKTLFPLLMLGAALAAPLALSGKITRMVEKSFMVQPGGSLKVSTEGGDITIKTGADREVHIVAKQVVRASTESEADKILAKLALTMEQSGDDVTVGAKYEKRAPGFLFGSWPPAIVSFVITVPGNYNVDLNTSGGSITVASLDGNVRARTSGGNLDFARIDGDIDGSTSGGNISLREGTARAVLRTSGGNIMIDRAGGPTDVSTSGGNIRINAVAQLINARTSGGDIYAVITEPLKQDTSLSTSGGDVRVRIVPDAGFELDASTSGGDVRAEGLTVTIAKGGVGRSRLAGTVNGGGPRLKLRSSGGDVTIGTD